MRKAHDKLNSRRKPGGHKQLADDDLVLTKAQELELDRRDAEMNDPKRYLLVTDFGERSTLIYNVSSNAFSFNNPAGGTLFTRRDMAEAVLKLLGDHVQLIPCKVVRRAGKEVVVLPKKNRRILYRTLNKSKAGLRPE